MNILEGDIVIATYHRDRYEGVVMECFGPDASRCSPFSYPDNCKIRITNLKDDINPYNYKYPNGSTMLIHKDYVNKGQKLVQAPLIQ